MDSAPAGLCAAGAAVGLCAAAAGVCAAGGGARAARAPPPVLPDELVEAYLKRLGLERPGLEPTLGSLNMLLSAHVDRVAYENLDIHMGRPPDSLEPAHTADRIARGGRGGYCFQLGGAFASLLASLGFEVSVHRATVRDDPAEMGAGPPVADSPEALAELNHLAVVVRLVGADGAEGLWLADVGLGDGPSKAVRLADSHTHSEPPFSYKVEQQPHGWRFIHDEKGSFGFFDLVMQPEVTTSAFAAAHHRLSTSPESSFVKTATVQRRTATGVHVLKRCALTRTGAEPEALTTQETWLAALTAPDGFGLAGLDTKGAEVDRLFSSVHADHLSFLESSKLKPAL